MVVTDLAIETIELRSSALIDTLFKEGSVLVPEDLKGSDGFLVLRNGQHSCLALMHKDKITLIKDVPEYQGVKAKDAAQRCFLWSLKHKQVTVCLGSAGCGKTFLSSAFALNQLFREELNIVMIKPTRFVGGDSNAIAAVPGGVSEKLEPYTESFLQHIRKILGRDADHFIFQFEENKRLEFAAVELVRGRHFENSIVILDEAQNLNFHELCSVVSRVDDTSKLLILGDPLQIDTDMEWEDTGLHKLIESEAWYDSDFAAGIELETSYRGRLANLVAEAIAERRQ